MDGQASHNMDHTKPVHTNEELKSNSEKDGILESDTGMSMQDSSGMAECEIGPHGHKKTPKDNVPLLVLDSPVDEEQELEASNTEKGPESLQPQQSPTGTVNELGTQATRGETRHEFSQIHPLVNEEQELDTPNIKQLLMDNTHCVDTTLGVINSDKLKAEVPEHEVMQPTLNTDGVNVSGDNEPPKKFLKNLSYHGTGRLPCPSLGDGWTIEQIVRQQGKSAGRYDTYYYSPLGAKIRSKLKLREFVTVDLTNFDYNSGKFIGSANVMVSPKPKMSLLKTDELKTIDRSTENNLNIPSSKQSKKLLIKLPPRKKLFPGICSSALDKKKLTKKAKKRKLSSFAARNAIGMDDDSSQNNPFETFKSEALRLSSHFEDMKDYDDLIQFAWNFLSIESKTRFNDIFATGNSTGPHDTSRPENCPVDCMSSLCDNRLQPETLEKPSSLDFPIGSFGMAGNDTFKIRVSTDTSHSAVSQNVLGNHTRSDIPMTSQHPSDLNSEYYESITDPSSLLVLAANQKGSTSLDNNDAINSSASLGRCNSKQKPHKRKSRVPVYIKQHSNGNEV